MVAPGGAATIGGLFFGPTASFGNQTLTNTDATGATADLVVGRLNSLATAWTQAVRGGSEAAFDLALTSSGEVTVVGIFQGATTTFGPTTLPATSPGGSAFVARTAGLTLGTRRTVAAEVLWLSPNPAHAAAFLLPATEQARLVVVLDAVGRPVSQQVVPARATAAVLDLTGLTPGLYVVRCGEASGRLIVE
ncbi:hypothetical protein [Hymenobacter algoricola]|uniref:T9SS type A sorting domain-containing protein n=1 Tax=Hymenobacter algoricola TaxID=486267 RepID=A0ABP7N1P2_9BACT